MVLLLTLTFHVSTFPICALNHYLQHECILLFTDYEDQFIDQLSHCMVCNSNKSRNHIKESVLSVYCTKTSTTSFPRINLHGSPI